MTERAIEIVGLSKVYRLYQHPVDRLKESLHPFGKKYHTEFFALHNVTLAINRGEVVGIIGRNGSGKSTLLKIVTGVLTPSSGNVVVNGKISALLELGSGFNPDLSGRENIYLNGSITGFTSKEMDSRLAEILTFADIGDYIDQPIKTYSNGMRARLAFAVAIHIDPDILIIDEILSVGDAAFQRKCFAKIENFRKQGKTIIFVSHSESQIVQLCDRAVLVHEGHKILEGVPKAVVQLYMKMLNSPNADVRAIQAEFVEKNNDSRLGEKAEREDKKEAGEPEVTQCEQPEAQFSRSIQSVSTIYYEERGARISDVKIMSLAGESVNVLEHGKSYVYKYDVEFFRDFDNVQFGMLIKTRTGLGLGGGVYPGIRDFMAQRKGKVTMKWRFKCLLRPDTYFTNAGVLSLDGSGSQHLHRILDAYAFKVTANPDVRFTAHVDFLDSIEIEQMEG